ncbi:hypothetical protein JAB1_14240 [Janthinobacterium sp. MP5059B]|nr:hypothetical protein JAB1_14240 [Janthinobacterium sp. MP5059B]
MKLELNAHRLYHFVRNLRSDFTMLFTKEHGHESARSKLKKRFYAGGHAVCAQIYRFVRGVERSLGLIHDRTMSVLVQLVLIKVRRFFFHLSQFFFEITFAIGQRRLLLLECEALTLNIKHSVVHVTDDYHD